MKRFVQSRRAVAVVSCGMFALLVTQAAATTSTNLPLSQSSVRTISVSNALAALSVKGRAPKTGYSRAQFGKGWKDTDHNGCDARNDVLARDFSNETTKNGCIVMSGTWTDPYSGVAYLFTHRPSELDIDHIVALSDAWQKGAAQWTADKRKLFANDPLNLATTVASINRSKGDKDAASWLPPLKTFRCRYVARQIAVKRKYGVWVTAAEKTAMETVLSKPACAGTVLPSGTSRP